MAIVKGENILNFVVRKNILTISAEMRRPGDSNVLTLTVLKRFAEEENPDEEPDTHVSKRHLITPFRDINADKRCSFLETFHRLRIPSLFLSISKSENAGPNKLCDFLEGQNRVCEEHSPKKNVRSGKRWGGAIRILPEKRVER